MDDVFRNRKALQPWPAKTSPGCDELILAKFRIRLAKIRPGVNIIHHQLEIVPVNVVIEAAQDRIEAVVTLLSGV